MSDRLPAPPLFGEPLPIVPNQAVLDFLALRRSASASTLRAPAPDSGQLADLLRLAARVPDHGKLAPWRFVVLEGAGKDAFAAALEAIAEKAPDREKRLGALFKLKTPPMAVALISRYSEGNIPEWEQRMSAGAVGMTLLIAAQAMGYGANWITDWYAYDPDVAALLGLQAGEKVAGFIYLGTAGEPPQERVRPDVAAITMKWAG